MSQSTGKTKKRSTIIYKRRKNHLSNRRRKDHFTKKRRKIKSRYNKRSVKRNRKTIKRNKRKYRGGSTKLIRVKFGNYSFYVQITPNNGTYGYNLEDPNSSGIMSIRSQVDYLILKDSDGRKDDFNFTLNLLKGEKSSVVSEYYYHAFSYNADSYYDHTYELIPESDFLVELCYSCSTLNKWDALEKEDVTVRWKSMISYRVEILENILKEMNLTDHREQFKYASEILYYLMKISETKLRMRLITRFKEILGDDFNTIAENRICRVWAHRTVFPRQFETIISPKCIIDEELLGLQKTDKLKELFNDIECNRCKVKVTSDTIKEGNSPFTKYTITLIKPDGSTDSFNFRWRMWRDNKPKVLDILKASRLGLKPVSYTDKEYFSKTWGKTGDDETVAKRVQMLIEIFNRQDLGEPGLFDESFYDLSFRIPQKIGEFEETITKLVSDSIQNLYDNIKTIFVKTAS